MSTYAVIQTGGKQYVVKELDTLIVDRMPHKESETVEIPALATFDSEKGTIELGMPLLLTKTKAQVVSHVKGDKIRVAKFKAKVRYRKVKGFRAQLTKLKILKV
ncbi:50S ribosomal protein L21 [Candidatus Roizmanbacteria bacterium]|nr:50S ribosomal protein L21 [Candidatus Roizmanbacteria bacterium]